MSSSKKTVFICESGDDSELTVQVMDDHVRVSIDVCGEPNEIDLSPEDVDLLVTELNTHKRKLEGEEA